MPGNLGDILPVESPPQGVASLRIHFGATDLSRYARACNHVHDGRPSEQSVMGVQPD
jgi:putative component of toxin-antitoxin plasmid stabilization module